MRIVLIDKKHNIIDEILLPNDTSIKDAMLLGDRIFVRSKLRQPNQDQYFYEKEAYNWLEEIEGKRIKY